MRVYYLDEEYEPDKHKIVKVYSKYFDLALPEDSPDTIINVPFSVLQLEEKYNRLLAKDLLFNSDHGPGIPVIDPISDDIVDYIPIPDKYYVNDAGDIVENETDTIVPVNPNPEKEAYKLSALHGLTHQQLDTIMDGYTTVADWGSHVRKLTHVVLYLVKQSELDE